MNKISALKPVVPKATSHAITRPESQSVKTDKDGQQSGSISESGLNQEVVTLLDVAKKANVSKSTASAAFLQKKSTIRISSETRKRILEAAKTLGYRPNIMAKSLATKKSFLIAMIGRKDLEYVTLPMVTTLQDILRKHDYSLVVYMCNNELEEEKEALELCYHRRVDAVLIQPNLDLKGRTNDKMISDLQKKGIVVIQLFNRVLQGVPTVKGDYQSMAYEAVKILYSKGRRNIGYLTYDFKTLHGYSEKGISEISQKYTGYKTAIKDLGLEEHLVTYPFDDNFRSMVMVYRNAESILPQLKGLDGVVAYCNNGGYGFLKLLEKNNIKVPEEIAVIGTSNDLHTPVPFMPELSYYSLDLAEVAKRAVSLCLELAAETDGSQEGKNEKNIILKPALFKGETL